MAERWQSAAYVPTRGIATPFGAKTTLTEVIAPASLVVTWCDPGPQTRAYILTGIPSIQCHGAEELQAAFPGAVVKSAIIGAEDLWPLLPGSTDPPGTTTCPS